MELNNETFERAFAMAKKDGVTITEENAEGYFMAALAQEMNMIHELINTSKGQICRQAMASNMANRMHRSLN